MAFILFKAYPQHQIPTLLLSVAKLLYKSGTIDLVIHLLLFSEKVLHSSSIVYSGKQFTSFFCSDCAIGKNHKLPFSASLSYVSVPLELVHCDVWGPAPTVVSQWL